MENVREEIMNSASEKMHKVGIKSISVDDICRKIGISKKTFYVYFAAKEDLITALMRRHEKEVELDILKCTAGKSIMDLLLGFMQIAEQTKDIRREPAFVHDLKKYYPQIFTEHIEQIREITKRLLFQYLQQGISEGFFRADLDPDKTASIFSYLHHELMNLSWQMTDEQHAETIMMARYGMDIFMRGIISEDGKKAIEEKLKTKSL